MTSDRKTFEEIQSFEKDLESRGYRKITATKATANDEFEWYKPSYCENREEWELRYQIFFQFWNFEKYQKGLGWSVSVMVMPESTINDVGRRDLELSVDWAMDIDRVERCAEKFYDFVREIDADE